MKDDPTRQPRALCSDPAMSAHFVALGEARERELDPFRSGREVSVQFGIHATEMQLSRPGGMEREVAG